ncbi:MAG: cation:proton antiporter [Candidatus Omnitrophota bacterium]
MSIEQTTIFSLGLILLSGFIFTKVFQKISVPTITAYILLGIVLGPFCLNAISGRVIASSGLISNVVLSFIAFSLGQNFSKSIFRRIGKVVMSISLGEVLGAWILVTLSLWLIARLPFHVALLFGAIAPATAPAAVLLITREYKAKGPFTDTLLGVVAIDDAWGIIIFAFSLAVARIFLVVESHAAGAFMHILAALFEIGGAFILGAALGFIFVKFSKYVNTQSELLIYLLGFILVNCGLAIFFGLSVLIANMTLSAVLINFHKTSYKFFEALRTIDAPFYLLFFVLAGANLEINLLGSLSMVGLVYVFTRLPGEMIGAYVGAKIAKTDAITRRYIGWGLAPQAGVALALALIAKEHVPEVGNFIFSTIIVTTIFYELIGPFCTRYALIKAGEISVAR